MWLLLACNPPDESDDEPRPEESAHSATDAGSTGSVAHTGQAHSATAGHTGDPGGCGDPADWYVAEVVFDAGGDALDHVAADLDGDGDDDLLVAEYYGESLAWYENGAGWARHTVASVWKWDAAALAAGDLDGDGLPELVSAQIDDLYYGTDSPVSVWPNTGGGTFPRAYVSADRPGHSSMHAVVADLAGDGLPELVVSQDDGMFVSEGGFAPLQRLGDPLFGRLKVGDLDDDGLLDVVGASTWLDGAGATRTFPALARTLDHAVADLDEDGDLDLVRFTETGVTWNEGTGGGSFAANTTLLDDPSLGSDGGLVVDVDQDGAADVLVFVYGTDARWLHNLGGGQFDAQPPPLGISCENVPGFGHAAHRTAVLDGADLVCNRPYPSGQLLVWRRQPCP